MHLRYGDDLMFHNYLSQLYVNFKKQGIVDFISSLKPEYAYSSFFWIINFFFYYMFSFFQSESIITLVPFIISLTFFLLSLFNIFKIYEQYFNNQLTSQIALLLFVMLPMSTHSAVRFHNYSLTLYLSSLLFYLVKKWNTLDNRRVISLSLLCSMLISTKLNGAFIGIACLGLIFSKKEFLKCFNMSKALTFSVIFFISYLLFMQPNLLFHILTWNTDVVTSSTFEYIRMIKEALRDNKINYFSNVLSLKDHYLSLYSFLLFSLGYFIWFIRVQKERVESFMIVACLGIFSSYIVLAGRIWHSSTYLIGISFLLPLSIKGFEQIKQRFIKNGLFAIVISFSLYHFIDRYHIMHARDLYISKGSPNYHLLKADQEIFLRLFPKPDNYRSSLRINCFIYSFCPWVQPLLPMDLSIVYEPSEDFLRNSDYIFINDKRWPDQTKFYLDQYEFEFIENLLSSLKIGEDEYNMIYKSEYIKVLKKK